MSNTANKPNYRFNNQDQIQSKDNKENGRVARTMTNHHPYLLKPSQQRDKTSLIPKIPRNKHIRQQQSPPQTAQSPHKTSYQDDLFSFINFNEFEFSQRGTLLKSKTRTPNQFFLTKNPNQNNPLLKSNSKIQDNDDNSGSDTINNTTNNTTNNTNTNNNITTTITTNDCSIFSTLENNKNRNDTTVATSTIYNISNNELVDTLSIVSSNLIVDDKYRLNIISDDASYQPSHVNNNNNIHNGTITTTTTTTTTTSIVEATGCSSSIITPTQSTKAVVGKKLIDRLHHSLIDYTSDHVLIEQGSIDCSIESGEKDYNCKFNTHHHYQGEEEERFGDNKYYQNIIHHNGNQCDNVSPSPSLSPPSSSYMQDQPSLDLLILSPQKSPTTNQHHRKYKRKLLKPNTTTTTATGTPKISRLSLLDSLHPMIPIPTLSSKFLSTILIDDPIAINNNLMTNAIYQPQLTLTHKHKHKHNQPNYPLDPFQESSVTTATTTTTNTNTTTSVVSKHGSLTNVIQLMKKKVRHLYNNVLHNKGVNEKLNIKEELNSENAKDNNNEIQEVNNLEIKPNSCTTTTTTTISNSGSTMTATATAIANTTITKPKKKMINNTNTIDNQNHKNNTNKLLSELKPPNTTLNRTSNLRLNRNMTMTGINHDNISINGSIINEGYEKDEQLTGALLYIISEYPQEEEEDQEEEKQEKEEGVTKSQQNQIIKSKETLSSSSSSHGDNRLIGKLEESSNDGDDEQSNSNLHSLESSNEQQQQKDITTVAEGAEIEIEIETEKEKEEDFYHDNNDSNTSLENFYGLDNEFLFNSITIK